MWVVVQMSENNRDTFGKKVEVITEERIIWQKRKRRDIAISNKFIIMIKNGEA